MRIMCITLIWQQLIHFAMPSKKYLSFPITTVEGGKLTLFYREKPNFNFIFWEKHLFPWEGIINLKNTSTILDNGIKFGVVYPFYLEDSLNVFSFFLNSIIPIDILKVNK